MLIHTHFHMAYSSLLFCNLVIFDRSFNKNYKRATSKTKLTVNEKKYAIITHFTNKFQFCLLNMNELSQWQHAYTFRFYVDWNWNWIMFRTIEWTTTKNTCTHLHTQRNGTLVQWEKTVVIRLRNGEIKCGHRVMALL